MSIRHEGQWHYEIIRAIDGSVRYRVADHDDDLIASYLTEEDAQQAVRAHNVTVKKNPLWLY